MRIALVVAVAGIGITVCSGLRQPTATILCGGRYDFNRYHTREYLTADDSLARSPRPHLDGRTERDGSA
jgi:hypothetical protein